jgi:hypothetical protein
MTTFFSDGKFQFIRDLFFLFWIATLVVKNVRAGLLCATHVALIICDDLFSTRKRTDKLAREHACMHMISFVLCRDVYRYARGNMHEQQVFSLGRFLYGIFFDEISLYGVRVSIPSLLGHLDPLKNTRLQVVFISA